MSFYSKLGIKERELIVSNELKRPYISGECQSYFKAPVSRQELLQMYVNKIYQCNRGAV